MDPVAPDVPPTSQRVRIALLHNRVVGHNLQVSLQRMEGERLRARHEHELERLKVLDLLTGPVDPPTGATLSCSLPTERSWLTADAMGSQSSLIASPRPRRKHPNSNPLKASHVKRVDDGEPSLSPEIHRRNTLETTTVGRTQTQRVPTQRRKSQSLSEVELSTSPGKDSKIRLPPLNLPAESDENINVDDENGNENVKEKPVARPHSACAARTTHLKEAARRRSNSVNLGESNYRPKRHGLLDPLSPRNTPNGTPPRRVLAKRFSEPELLFSRPHVLPTSPLCNPHPKFNDRVPGSSASSSEESVGSEEEDAHLQPYSIGKMCVRESKGSFEQKTGKEGLRAWVGLSTKPKKRPLWFTKMH